MNKIIIIVSCMLVLQTGCASVDRPDLGAELVAFELRCQQNAVKVCEVGSLKGCACYSM